MASSSSPIRVGLIGFGNIGAGVVRWMEQNRALMAERVGREVVLARIADVDIERDRGVKVDRSALTTNAYDIINDPTIQIVIELVGGTGKAREFVEAAIRAGKHVVTANKALLATFGGDLVGLAAEHGVVIGAEASVGAGIPVIRAMHQCLVANRFKRVAGIVNGTCNYILTEMDRDGKPFAEVLAEAQRLGYAEPDPSFDIEGTDAAHKIAILAALAFGQDIRIGDVERTGITALGPAHFAWARKQGLRLKLVASASQDAAGAVSVGVAPTLVPTEGLLGPVLGVYNAFVFEGEPIGKTLTYGRGAGQDSTSSGVMSDVVVIAAALERGGLTREWMLKWPKSEKKIQSADKALGTFVLSAALDDQAAGGRPGALLDAVADSGVALEAWEASGGWFWATTKETSVAAAQKAMASVVSKIGSSASKPGGSLLLRLERGL